MRKREGGKGGSKRKGEEWGREERSYLYVISIHHFIPNPPDLFLCILSFLLLCLLLITKKNIPSNNEKPKLLIMIVE